MLSPPPSPLCGHAAVFYDSSIIHIVMSDSSLYGSSTSPPFLTLSPSPSKSSPSTPEPGHSVVLSDPSTTHIVTPRTSFRCKVAQTDFQASLANAPAPSPRTLRKMLREGSVADDEGRFVSTKPVGEGAGAILIGRAVEEEMCAELYGRPVYEIARAGMAEWCELVVAPKMGVRGGLRGGGYGWVY